MKGELREQGFLTEILRKAAEARERSGEGQGRKPEGVPELLLYEIYTQKDFHDFAQIVRDRILEYVKLETSKLSSDWKSVA